MQYVDVLKHDNIVHYEKVFNVTTAYAFDVTDSSEQIPCA